LPDTGDDLQFAASGSGFAVSTNGHLVTNFHVIEGCEEVILHSEGKQYLLDLITFDPKNDLALLKADFRPAAVFALSNKRPELLQDIYVAGYPFGYEISSSVKVTKGIISSLTGIGNDYSNIQIDAALQSGNSGGPILDDYGNLVGVAVAKLDVEYLMEHFGDIPENTNFGIKANVLAGLLDSNAIPALPANDQPINKSQLGRNIANGTFYLSCWMTPAQMEAMADKQ
jgi:serine protease Do